MLGLSGHFSIIFSVLISNIKNKAKSKSLNKISKSKIKYSTLFNYLFCLDIQYKKQSQIQILKNGYVISFVYSLI